MAHRLGFDAIGTRWEISTLLPLEAALRARVAARIEVFDAVYSRFRSDSLVTRLARAAGSYQFPDDARRLFRLYRSLYDCTAGAVTPLVGGALEHLGYDPRYSFRRAAGTAAVPVWDDVLTVRGSRVTTTQPVVLDVGAAGKGYLVDLVAELLLDAGVDSFVVDASGDLVHRGTDVERVGLESPFTPGQVVGVANLANAALCASAVTRRSWGAGLHHIVDPGTGEPVTGVVASWVVHRSCAVADGLATALFLVPPGDLRPQFDFSFVRVFDDGQAEHSDNFDGTLFT